MYQRILVPIDGSETSKRGLQAAIDLAKLSGGRLRLMHVTDELSFALAMNAYSGYAGDWIKELHDDGRRILDQARTTVQAAGVEADTVQRDKFSGSVYEEVTAQAVHWPADLIVVGTHGRRGVGRLVMGSSAENILRYASVPVLLVRAPAADSKSEPEAQHEATKVKLPSSALSFE
jgi:nucleotide-binding universal stress UspA family protein